MRYFSSITIYKRRFSSYLHQDGTYHKLFADYIVTTVKGGKGGNGSSLLLHLKCEEFAGPGGGDGGNGGHLIFEATNSKKSLHGVPTLLQGMAGASGRRGRGGAQDGAHAGHKVVHVPLGTIIRESGKTLVDLKQEGDRYIAARGGIGGLGNRGLATSQNTRPITSSEGSPGECRLLELELSIVAQVGLVGFPNAGKSSLLRCISNATPEVASYPFTTLNPHIGMVAYEDAFQLAVADIPGIVRGAHLNKGLGLSFLKHIRRCLSLVYVIDVSVDSYQQQLEYLKFELEQYQKGLSQAPCLIVANKIDTESGKSNLAKMREVFPNERILGVSALEKINIPELCRKLRELNNLT